MAVEWLERRLWYSELDDRLCKEVRRRRLYVLFYKRASVAGRSCRPRPGALVPEDSPNLIDKLFWIERLVQETRCSVTSALEILSVRGVEDNGNFGQALIFF